MRIELFACLAVGAALLLTPSYLQAHHGWAEFDLNRELTLEGTVADFHFVNPHCVVEFDVKDAEGRLRRWQGEFSSPGPLSRKGWTAATLQPGDAVTVTGYAGKDNTPALHVIRIRLPNGQEFQVDSQR